jgi:hypothetical protein
MSRAASRLRWAACSCRAAWRSSPPSMRGRCSTLDLSRCARPRHPGCCCRRVSCPCCMRGGNRAGTWPLHSLTRAAMQVVFEWARGLPFRDICALTSVAEGTIVRCITRLDETCREVRHCCERVCVRAARATLPRRYGTPRASSATRCCTARWRQPRRQSSATLCSRRACTYSESTCSIVGQQQTGTHWAAPRRGGAASYRGTHTAGREAPHREAHTSTSSRREAPCMRRSKMF